MTGLLGLLVLFALGAVLGYRYAYACGRVEAAVRFYDADLTDTHRRLCEEWNRC